MSVNAQHSRFKDAPWYPKKTVYTLVGGAGGIGSWLSLLLSRAGFSVMVYDFDILEDHNLGGQLYNKSMIGRYKVAALKEVVESFSDNNITVVSTAYSYDSGSNDVMFSAFDNMEARKGMFSAWKDAHTGNPSAIFIDGRLNAEQMQILCIRGDDEAAIAKYAEEYLFSDAEVEDTPCTMKQTSHAAAMIASHMVSFFTNHITNVVEKDTIRSVPFYWEYFIPMDLTETIQDVK